MLAQRCGVVLWRHLFGNLLHATLLITPIMCHAEVNAYAQMHVMSHDTTSHHCRMVRLHNIVTGCPPPKTQHHHAGGSRLPGPSPDETWAAAHPTTLLRADGAPLSFGRVHVQGPKSLEVRASFLAPPCVSPTVLLLCRAACLYGCHVGMLRRLPCCWLPGVCLPGCPEHLTPCCCPHL